jgi:protease IV
MLLHIVRVAAVLLALITLSGCSRASITFALGDAESPLTETTVLQQSINTASSSNSGGKIAMIDVRGVIADAPRPAILSAGINPVDDFLARLSKAERDPDVRAVVIRINSPGGSVTASDILHREVQRFRDTTGKPVVASFGEVAASGGYYLALACDEIVTEPTTITASIGVIIPTVNVSAGMQRIGIISRAVKSGKNKDLANPLEPMRDGQYAVLQAMVDEYYARFRALVIQRRASLDHSRIDDLTDGRIVTGADAVRAGLADSEGGLRDAMTRAMILSGLRSARLVKYHAQGQTPRSPYAQTTLEPLSPWMRDAGQPASSSAIEMNLLKLEGVSLGIDGITTGGAYYLWEGALP